MLAPITIRYPFRAAKRSLAVGEVVDLFGLHTDEPAHTIAENLELPIQPQHLVLFTGPSGSGKSSIMRAVAQQLNAVDANLLELPDVPLVDALQGPIENRLSLLAAVGLSEARLLLRTPAELSDGQRYRFRIAFALHTQSMPIVLDEFGANLDRTLAKVVSFNLRKQLSRMNRGALCATTHDDLADDLQPDVHVRCLGEGRVDVQQASVKKKRSALPMNSGFPQAPDAIGRTSLGGITARITSPLPSA